MSLRSERKYTFDSKENKHVEDLILSSPLGLRKEYDNRWVNSVYFDDEDLSSYEENLAGISKRTKVRIRWYTKSLDDQIGLDTIFCLEIKCRNNVFGTKLQHEFTLPENIINSGFQSILGYLRREIVPPHFLPFLDNPVVPILSVHYQRAYYQNSTGEVRATIDNDLSFSRPSSQPGTRVSRSGLFKMEYGVLELKFPVDTPAETIEMLVRGNSFRAGRHSKYAVGCYVIHR